MVNVIYFKDFKQFYIIFKTVHLAYFTVFSPALQTFPLTQIFVSILFICRTCNFHQERNQNTEKDTVFDNTVSKQDFNPGPCFNIFIGNSFVLHEQGFVKESNCYNILYTTNRVRLEMAKHNSASCYSEPECQVLVWVRVIP